MSGRRKVSPEELTLWYPTGSSSLVHHWSVLQLWHADIQVFDVCPRPLLIQTNKQPKHRRGRRAGKHNRSQPQRTEGSFPAPIQTIVVNLSKRTLTDAETSLLRKGLTFCPTTLNINRLQLTADLHEFYRRLRLREYFSRRPDISQSTEDSALKNTNLARKSLWQPPKSERSPEVEIFIKVLHESVSKALGSYPRARQTHNLTHEEQQALKNLGKYDDIVIRPADKGSAVVVQDATSYDAEVRRQLSDSTFYKPLARDPTLSHNDRVRDAVQSLLANGSINKKTASDLVETKVRVPHFYTLPKIHKSLDNPPGRPIVSSNNAPTERISAFVDKQLQPLVTSLPSYIKDTKHFLRRLQSLPPLPPDALLFTMDVVGLYTNIPHEDGLKACQTMLNCRPTLQPPTGDIICLARLVLELNAFQYGDQHYLQTKGTAMGTRMAPSYANLFMGCLETSILQSAPSGLTPALYGRFIDDVFGVWLHGEEAFEEFVKHANACHESISFTHSLGRTVNYLDVTATINGEVITTDLYTKPTDRHQYLLPTSDHPPHVHQHLPYGLAVRICGIVSEPPALNRRLEELADFLTCRGYPAALVRQQLAKARVKPRCELLQDAGIRKTSNRTPLVCTWDHRLPPLNTLVRLAFPVLSSNERLSNVFELPLVSYRRPRNLRNLLVRTKPTTDRTSSLEAGTYPCKTPRCKTCDMISAKHETSWEADHRHRVRQHYTCLSSSVIYLIQCSSCNAVYIGETGCTLRARMTQHRSTIRNGEDTPVAQHFALPGHTPNVCVVDSTPCNTTLRRIAEGRWISNFKKVTSVKVMNRDDGAEFLPL